MGGRHWYSATLPTLTSLPYPPSIIPRGPSRSHQPSAVQGRIMARPLSPKSGEAPAHTHRLGPCPSPSCTRMAWGGLPVA